MKINQWLLLAALGAGGYLLWRWYQSQQQQSFVSTLPAGVQAGLANPAAARLASLDTSSGTTAYPGITPLQPNPAFNPNDPLGLGSSLGL